MTRECKKDLTNLRQYISQYSIESNLDNLEYSDALKEIHKSFFSIVTWNAELETNKADFCSIYSNFKTADLDRLCETISDISSSIFNWINGSYKASRIMLRVGIENFIRAIGGSEDASLLAERSAYTLFEKAKVLNIFTTSLVIKNTFNQLHSDYKILCKDTHTDNAANMDLLSSLAGLPVFKKEKAASTKLILVRVSKNINILFCMIFNDFYHKMHHRNRENVLNSIPKKVKPNVLGNLD